MNKQIQEKIKESDEFVDEKHWSTRVDPRLLTETDVKEFLLEALSQNRQQVIEEVIKLSEECEIKHEDGMSQWKGFKCLRNTLRDKLK